MKRIATISAALALLVPLAVESVSATRHATEKQTGSGRTVPAVDLDRCVGDWFEIAPQDATPR